ncbi:hypothetical protein WRP3_074 [Lactococcus phage WRP3]|uniref:Uncharacterized protein n=1 Tax=Lactococcus phage WRP3 TaxID=1560313 RepID=A0A0D3MST7_9CAUD|nr:hypothetical protein ACQ37_gp074 [Lactococcus phage WRP3]AIX12577.1 hypothetical protein WRP3_074 [Lactococcus phage WRP3]
MLVDVLQCPKCSKFIRHQIEYADYEGCNDVIELEARDFVCECLYCDTKFVFNLYVTYSATKERIDDKRVEEVENGDY